MRYLILMFLLISCGDDNSCEEKGSCKAEDNPEFDKPISPEEKDGNTNERGE